PIAPRRSTRGWRTGAGATSARSPAAGPSAHVTAAPCSATHRRPRPVHQRATMRAGLEIALTGLAAVRLYPLRSAACVGALVAALLPYLTGQAVALGLEAEAGASAEFGADLYVSGEEFGRAAPVPLDVAAQLRGVDGVAAVTPRIVGAVTLGKERVPAVLVGLPPEHSPAWAACMDGDLPRPGGPHELVIGTALAARLKLGVGSVVPPFY